MLCPSEDMSESNVPNENQPSTDSHSDEVVGADTPKPKKARKSRKHKPEIVGYDDPTNSDAIATSEIDEKSQMTKGERTLLIKLEERVIKHLAGFIEALHKIREKKLYRRRDDGTSRTWDQYCNEVLEKTKQSIDKDLKAHEIKLELSKSETLFSELLYSRSSFLELDGLTLTEMVSVCQLAQEMVGDGNKIPTKQISLACEKLFPDRKPVDTAIKPAKNEDILKKISDIHAKFNGIEVRSFDDLQFKDVHHSKTMDMLRTIVQHCHAIIDKLNPGCEPC